MTQSCEPVSGNHNEIYLPFARDLRNQFRRSPFAKHSFGGRLEFNAVFEHFDLTVHLVVRVITDSFKRRDAGPFVTELRRLKGM